MNYWARAIGGGDAYHMFPDRGREALCGAIMRQDSPIFDGARPPGAECVKCRQAIEADVALYLSAREVNAGSAEHLAVDLSGNSTAATARKALDEAAAVDPRSVYKSGEAASAAEAHKAWSEVDETKYAEALNGERPVFSTLEDFEPVSGLQVLREGLPLVKESAAYLLGCTNVTRARVVATLDVGGDVVTLEAEVERNEDQGWTEAGDD